MMSSTLNNTADLTVLEGVTPYDTALALQQAAVAKRRAREIPDTLMVLEHTPVITVGRNADDAGIVASLDVLEGQGIQVRHTDRGGQVTYHGPGQIIGYPIIDLRARGLGVRAYVSRLEETMIIAAQTLHVTAGRQQGIVGVFCDQGKLGAVGVRIANGISYHGFAFNVAPHLAHYQHIIPCGMADIPVTSIAEVTGMSPSIRASRQAVIDAFEVVFGVHLLTSTR
ncbi:MAG: lipoyl(octanoyl) transferase LipB [Myxococcota bacterium]|nr:lipoyl(octanoyl) transferase LipB [Myxococcota bacterium]